MSRSQKSIISILLLSSIIPFFQNCTPRSAQSLSKDQASSLNQSLTGGEGYDGKITYINRPEGGFCADGLPLRSIIQMKGDSGQILRENCVDIQPKEVTRSGLDLMLHNLANAVHDKQVFDLLSAETTPESSESLSTKYFCRGRYENKNNKQMQVADVMIRYKQDGKLAHSARVIMAVYSPEGKLLETLDTGGLELRNIETEVEGRVKYVTPVIGRHSITLWIDKTGSKKTGKLSLIDLPYQGRDLEKPYNFRDFERVIQNLECVE